VIWLLLLTACVSGVLKDAEGDDTDLTGDTDVTDSDAWETGTPETDLPGWVDAFATQPLIVEVCDTEDRVSSFVELANPTNRRIRLEGWSLKRYHGIDRNPVATSSLDELAIPAGGTIVITTSSGESGFDDAWGDGADAGLPAVGGDGEDAYGLYDASGLVDLYGALGVDGKNQPWKYADTCSRRKVAVSEPSKAWNKDEWSVGVWPGEPFQR
jgi:hypothetical protein